MTVAADSYEIIFLDITPPDSVERKDGGYNIDLTAEAEDDSSVTFTEDISLNVKTVNGVEIVIEMREKTIDKAGDSVNYIVRVTNTGNSEVTIEFTLEKSESDWNVEMSDNADIFAPGAEKEFTLTVTSPDPVDNKEECRVTVTAKILGDDTTMATESTNTEVKKDTGDSLIDTIEEYSWVIAIGLTVIVVALVVFFRSRELEEEEEYDEEYEGYGEEDDD